MQKLHSVQAAYLREMQAIIAGSRASECVGLYCPQLMDLSSAEDNAFAKGAERSADREGKG